MICFFFQADDGIRDRDVTGVQTCALPILNADGTSGQTRLTDYPGRDQDPDWSPDGRKIAFERDIEPIELQILEVFVMNADGSGVTPLTSLPSENGHPGWARGLVLGA